MAKMLNLEEVAATTEKSLKIDDVVYPMAEVSVERFIQLSRKAQEIEAAEEKIGEEKTLVDRIEMLVESILEAFPTCPPEVLRRRPLSQLFVILEFIRSDVTDGSDAVAEKK